MQFCVSASDGGQQGPRCDREGGTGPLGAATAGRQGDLLAAVQWNREDVTVSESLPHSLSSLFNRQCNRHTESLLHH